MAIDDNGVNLYNLTKIMDRTGDPSTPIGGMYLYSKSGRLFGKNDDGNAQEVLSKTGSFTGTLQGYATAYTVTVYYRLHDDIVDLFLPHKTENSNSNILTMTGIPSNLRPTDNRYFGMVRCVDGGQKNQASGYVDSNGKLFLGRLHINSDRLESDYDDWDTTGVKGFNKSTITYYIK